MALRRLSGRRGPGVDQLSGLLDDTSELSLRLGGHVVLECLRLCHEFNETSVLSGGSLIHVTWERHPTTFLARILIVPLVQLTGGAPVRSSLRKALERLEAREA